MAQPVFDDHPLGQYLREAGETSGLMPGGIPEFMGTLEEDEEITQEELDEVETIEKVFEDFLESVTAAFSSQSFSAFTEKFKYSVISSSLLSSSLTTTPHTRRTTPNDIPGNLHSRAHSRNSSVSSTSSNPQIHPSHSFISESQYVTFSLAIAFLTILFGAGYYCTSVSLAAILLYIFKNNSSSTFMTPTLDTLNDLIVAGNVWDSVVQEVMTKLEKDEKHSNTPTSPRSNLRVTLHSTLLTTQNQSDNVRQLLSALASQTELSQITYMYAPPSPQPKGSFFTAATTTSTTTTTSRPFSLPTRRRTISNPNPDLSTSAADKRATWNGSYASLAGAGSPTMQILKRREKRRSDLSALLQVTSSTSTSNSAPVTPSRSAPDSPRSDLTLEGVAEETSDESLDLDHDHDGDGDEQEQFGMAALQLRRRRRMGGLHAFGLHQTPPSLHRHKSLTAESYSTTATPGTVGGAGAGGILSPTYSHPRSPLSPRSTLGVGVSASRFTGHQAPRHPLSLSALRQALQGAIGSKRYACSHLLALRFAEEKDDEVYWEDVRSVMELLTTTLTDASARLTVALEEVERIRLQDEQPTPAFGGKLDLEESENEGGSVFGRQQDQEKHQHRRKSQLALSSFSSSSTSGVGFAPMPSHVARFAAHVDAISTALSDAREQLEECVAKLREEGAGEEEESSHGANPRPEGDSHPALEAYERLRRELGLALRECERGRERLLDVVHPPRSRHSDDEDEEEHADLPGLGHDGSDESDDKPEPVESEHHNSHPEPEVTVVNASDHIDDATSHLLFTSTTEHLPPPGIEQVYEGDSGNVGVFTREKSKLSREERIQLVKKARESGRRLSDLGIHLPQMMDEQSESMPKMERWGPGGEVVQELKDVIWKVGERRRKMTDLGHGVPPVLRAGEAF
ncbi:hypothetical protein V5O48_006533 [Marasmius crinis-equi]|uniref:Myosin-binding domain-containing protein n=1 Tax=Marasmius crinis-equi TaxID=585013 RepID=A0ABR3FJF8_9AGAR